MTRSLYFRLCSFYFFYFAFLGALIPFWGLYLQDIGFNSSQIGLFLAIIAGTKIVSPNLLGYLADKTGQVMNIVRLCSFVTLLSFLFLFFINTFWQFFFLNLIFSFFWNASLSQFEANTMAILKKDTFSYSRIRVWGSLGFVLAVILCGVLFIYIAIDKLSYVLILLCFAIFVSSLLVGDVYESYPMQQRLSFWSILKKKQVLLILFLSFIIQVTHGVYYSFYSIFLNEHSYSSIEVGFLWSLAVISEIVVFIFMDKLLKKFPIKPLLLFVIVIVFFRWLIIGWGVDNIFLLIIGQMLHAITYGVFHATTILLVAKYFRFNTKSRGQALYLSLSYGAGGAIGSGFAGLYWDNLGGSLVFSICSIVIFFVFLFYYLKFKNQTTI
jgi:MFS transporter, PPP family, 3-phenylpropionic acid transporter